MSEGPRGQEGRRSRILHDGRRVRARMLLHEYGITPDSIEWFSARKMASSGPSRIDFVLPKA